jgi:hypothetical protein
MTRPVEFLKNQYQLDVVRKTPGVGNNFRTSLFVKKSARAMLMMHRDYTNFLQATGKDRKVPNPSPMAFAIELATWYYAYGWTHAEVTRNGVDPDEAGLAYELRLLFVAARDLSQRTQNAIDGWPNRFLPPGLDRIKRGSDRLQDQISQIDCRYGVWGKLNE